MATKKKQKIIKYWCEIYRMNYYFFLGWPIDTFTNHMNKNYGYEVEGHQRLTGKTLQISSDGFSGFFVWVKDIENFPVLAHECLHATNWTLGEIGVHADFVNDEAQAYLLTALLRQATGIDK